MDAIDICLIEFDNLYEDSSYSAQSYFEAAKSASFWGKAIVFIPAICATVAALLVALGEPKQWGAVGAIAGAITATSSFLGSDRNSKSFADSGKRFTLLRHTVKLERSFVTKDSDGDEVEEKLRLLRAEYGEIVRTSELVPNRLFGKARKRIGDGVLSYKNDKKD